MNMHMVVRSGKLSIGILSLIIGISCSVFAFCIHFFVFHIGAYLLEYCSVRPYLAFGLPLSGLVIFYGIKKVFFPGFENKGLKEIIVSHQLNEKLPFHKVMAHYFSGIFTVAFGGSTGIEVSTVVSSGVIGSNLNKWFPTGLPLSSLIAAGVASGISALFVCPLAGIFFCIEVLCSKISDWKTMLFIGTSSFVAFIFSHFVLHHEVTFVIRTLSWNYYALPFFIALGIFSGIGSVALTRVVMFFKYSIPVFQPVLLRIIIGGLSVGFVIYYLPQLYGEGFSLINDLMRSDSLAWLSTSQLMLLVLVLFLKPIITSLTLYAGGDGGVFAPSMFMGSVMGYLLAWLIITFLHIPVVPLNFVIVGMAALLSSSIHAPVTAIFLVCSITNQYQLLIPLTIACFTSKITAYKLFPATVYNYKPASA